MVTMINQRITSNSVSFIVPRSSKQMNPLKLFSVKNKITLANVSQWSSPVILRQVNLISFCLGDRKTILRARLDFNRIKRNQTD